MSESARLDILAIVKAVVIAFVLSLAIGAMIGFVGIGLLLSGYLSDDMIDNSIMLHGVLFCLGLLPEFICGYLAATFAKRNYLIHGVVAGLALLVCDGAFYLFPDEDPFTLMDGAALILNVPLAALGSMIRIHYVMIPINRIARALSLTRITPMRAGIIATVFLIVAVAVSQLHWVQVHYHQWRMQRSWNATFVKPESIHDGLASYHLGSDYDAYEYHRAELVKLGVIHELQHAFNHLQVPTPESKHFVKLLLSGECPPRIDFESVYPDKQEPMTLTVWFYAKHADHWKVFLQEHDIKDYYDKFVAPSIIP